jgi:hypothetical protein
MTATEMKRKLIGRINKTEDKELLKSIYLLTEDESKKERLILSDQQLTAVNKARKQISSGNFLTDTEVRKRTTQWLGK